MGELLDRLCLDAFAGRDVCDHAVDQETAVLRRALRPHAVEHPACLAVPAQQPVLDLDATGEALARGESVEIEYRLLGHDGQTRWVLDRMRPEGTAEDGSLLVDGVVADITARKRIEAEAIEKLAHAALRDSLTGLANRTAFLEHLDAALARASRTGEGAAVLFIDLDNFKLVNDSFGHSAGDELLKAVGSRLRTAIRQTDVVARQGGDEFLILLSDLERNPTEETAFMGAAEVVANTLRRSLRAPFLVEGIEIYISASVGISIYPSDADDSTTLLKHADVAMYTVKEAGRDGHALYRSATDTALEQISMASRLRKTVEGGHGLVLHYQPLVDLEAGTLVGVEALVRWQDGSRGLVPPGDFIPLAEQIGLIGLLSDWVIDEACRQALAWQEQGLDLYVSINLPPSYCQTTGMAHLASAAAAAGRRARAADGRGDRVSADPRHGTADGRHPRRHAQAGTEARDRRLRHRLLVSGTTQQELGQHAEDRPLLHPGSAPSTSMHASSSPRSSSSPTRWASSRSPKASKPRNSAASCSRTTAATDRDSSSAAPSRNTRSRRSTTRTPGRTDAWRSPAGGRSQGDSSCD